MLPPSIAAEAAITQANVTLSLIKQTAQAERQIANILDQAVQNVPTSSIGSRVNISA